MNGEGAAQLWAEEHGEALDLEEGRCFHGAGVHGVQGMVGQARASAHRETHVCPAEAPSWYLPTLGVGSEASRWGSRKGRQVLKVEARRLCLDLPYRFRDCVHSFRLKITWSVINWGGALERNESEVISASRELQVGWRPLKRVWTTALRCFT